MHTSLLPMVGATLVLMLTACSSSDDEATDGGSSPSGMGGQSPTGTGGQSGASGSYTFDTSDFTSSEEAAIQGSLTCAPAASQAFVFGDSISACYNVSESECGVGVLEDHLDGVPLENAAVSGSVTADVVDQIAGVTPSSGPALVLIQVLGNDLTPFIALSNEEAETQILAVQEQLQKTWEEGIYPALDKQFPDGYSLILSLQYKPLECSLGDVKEQLIVETNNLLISIAASHSDTTIVANSYPGFLGHANGFDNMDCPSYSPSNVGWMSDIIHPNELGHSYLGALWSEAADYLKSSCP